MREPFQVRQPVIAHGSPGQIQFFEISELSDVSQTSIRNQRSVQIKANKLLEGCYMSKSRIVQPRVSRNQRLQPGERLQMRESGCRNSRRQRQ